jgi:hydroxyacylglutathione hydrolase
LREVTEVAAGVYVATAARDLTNTTVLVSGPEALLVDPCWTPSDLEGLVQWLSVAGLRGVAGFATPAHHDHVLWHPDFGDVPRWASAITAERARIYRGDLIAGLGPGWPPDLTALVGQLTATAEKTLPWPSRVELIRHDAHTPGHTALWLPEQRVLIAGDMLSDVEPPLPEETGVPEYLEGLKVLEPYVEQAAVVIPGHGHPGTDAVARWRTDLAAIKARA